MRPLVAGNWKMNGLGSALPEIDAICAALADEPVSAEVIVCPPTTLLSRAVACAGGRIGIGAQDCHAQRSGAYTGDISAEMLKDAGADYVIVGHSERRTYHGETDADVIAKARAALAAGLIPIVCVGETEAERDAGRAGEVVSRQLRGSVPQGEMDPRTAIAYEPVWAIGTGRTPTGAQIVEMHRLIRSELGALPGKKGRAMRILYGGSVKPSNASEILSLPEVGGALVGGASLRADEFRAIFRSAPPNR
jgi:triosephosphate isomerase (TIM)